MLILIPHLFPPSRVLEAGSSTMRAPALETLVARGRLELCPAEGVEAALCHAFGVPRQQDWPIAPIALEADGGKADDAYWLRADPVHLRVMRDRVVLAHSGALNLTQQESDALTESIGAHFGTSFHPRALQPAHWYISLTNAPRLQTTPLALAAGRDIQPLMPQGEDALQFRGLLNEVQMLLHTHPVNQIREQRGELPVNGLWLWGGGIKPITPTRSSVTLYTQDRTSAFLATRCGAQVRHAETHMNAAQKSLPAIAVLDELVSSGQCGDTLGWWEAMSTLERDWFAPLLGSLGRLMLDTLILSDPINGKTLRVSCADVWKIWRRPTRLPMALERAGSSR